MLLLLVLETLCFLQIHVEGKMILSLANRECRASECPSMIIGTVPCRIWSNLNLDPLEMMLSSVQNDVSAAICNDRDYMITNMKPYEYLNLKTIPLRRGALYCFKHVSNWFILVVSALNSHIYCLFIRLFNGLRQNASKARR